MRCKIILITILICLVSVQALADTGVPQTLETQGIVSSTTISTLGTVTETDTLAWQNFNCGLCGLSDITPLFFFDHAIYSTSYSENTIADQGMVTYAKQNSLDTQGKVSGQYNLETAKVVEFVGLDTGRMVSKENSVMDGAGTIFETEEVMICPFAAEQSLIIPAFCNNVEEGSSLDLTLGSVTTSTRRTAHHTKRRVLL